MYIYICIYMYIYIYIYILARVTISKTQRRWYILLCLDVSLMKITFFFNSKVAKGRRKLTKDLAIILRIG